MSQTVVRRGRVTHVAREDATWLRWTDGTVADIRDCPRMIMSRSHWERVGERVDGPNAVCACTEGGAS